MKPRLILAGALGAAFFTAVWEAGVYAVPGPMETLPTVAGLVCPPAVALLWLLILTANDDEEPVTVAQRRRPATEADRAGSTR